MCQTALYVGWAASATLGVWGSLPFHGPPPALAPAFLQHPSPTHVPSSKSSSSSLPLRPGPHSLARIRLPWPKSPSPCRPPPPILYLVILPRDPFYPLSEPHFPKGVLPKTSNAPSFCRGKGTLSSQCSRESVDSAAPSGEQPSSEDSCIVKPASPALSQDFPGSVATETSVSVTSINSPQAWCVTDPTLGRAT